MPRSAGRCIPLAGLDDWLDFAEALLGTQDVPADSLVSEFETLAELDAVRGRPARTRWAWTGRTSWRSAYPWAGAARDIAAQQGFFHWELEFAQVFGRGGYDLQVGNPPWVRPSWEEDPVLAELDPWFMLTEKPGASEWRLRRGEARGSTPGRNILLNELAANAGTVAIPWVSPTTYPAASRDAAKPLPGIHVPGVEQHRPQRQRRPGPP